MGLVSALYRLAPSPANTGPDRALRNRRAVRRCLEVYGVPDVRARIAAAPPSDLREHVGLLVEGEAVRQWIRRR